MDISSLINAGLLSGALMAAHEGGHQSTANNNNVSLRWSGDRYSYDSASPRAAAEIQGAGFSGQDGLKTALNGTEQEKLFDGLSALHKASYLLRDRGDIEGLEKASGNRHVKELIAGTGLWDVVKALAGSDNETVKNMDLSFTTIDGSPGILLRLKTK